MEGIRPLLNFETHESNATQTEWILMIHGAGGSTRTWKKQIPAFFDSHNIVVIDLPGHAASSEACLWQNNYSFEWISEEIWRVVDHLKINGVHLMGVSLGSIISMQMYHSRPKAIRSMIFAGPIVALNNKLRIWAKIGLTTAKVIGYRNFYALMSKVVMPRKNHQKSRDIFVRESKLLSNKEYKKWTSMYGKYLDVKLKQLFDACPQVPTFILVGKQDHMFFKPAMEYAERFRNIQIQIIDRCGHLVSLEKAEIFNQHCKVFFEKLRLTSK